MSGPVSGHVNGHYARLVVADGSSQQGRSLPAQSGSYFKAADMSLEQLLALALEYARLVRFYRLDLQPDGNWAQYFQADEAVLLAMILSFDQRQLDERFERTLVSYFADRDWLELDLAFDLGQLRNGERMSALLLARLLDHWLQCASLFIGPAGQELESLLTSVLRGLDQVALTLLKSTISPEHAIRLRAGLSPRFNALVWPAPGVALPTDVLSAASSEVVARANFHTFLQALNMVQDGARRLLPISLRSGQHDPAAALLISFAQLLEKMQLRLNRFGQSYLDFYYRQVLRVAPQPLRPDRAFLALRTTPGCRQITLEQGTAFVAGVDQNQRDILYVTEQAAVLGDARVVALHTLYFERGQAGAVAPPLATPGTSLLAKAVANSSAPSTNSAARSAPRTLACTLQQIGLLPDSYDGKGQEQLPPRPLMGAPKPGTRLDEAQPQNLARFGFALAARVLLLREGRRKVRILLQYCNTPGNTLEDSLARLAQEQEGDQAAPTAHTAHTARAAGASQQTRLNDVFIKLTRGMFRIALTSNNGWYEVDQYLPSYRGLDRALPADCLALEFFLPADAPPICGLQAQLHGSGYDTLLPVARFEMAQNEFRYPYDLLSGWILRDIKIEVEVQGCRQLLLHNNIGRLSAESPFMPFGPLPTPGAYLVVGCEETQCKNLTDLKLELEWGGLPRAAGGLAAYYHGYARPLDRDAVQAQAAALVDYVWQRGGAPLGLFSGTAAHSVLSLQAVAELARPLPGLPHASFAAQTDFASFKYTPSTQAGLFRLELAGSEGGFGHQEYPALLASVLTQNARQKKPLALPNPPYTPQIDNIMLHYQAQASIDFCHSGSGSAAQVQDKMLHLHPLGMETLHAMQHSPITQVPACDAPANLFIGLQASHLAGMLSLYFYLREDSLPMTGIANSGLAWRFLANNRWQALAPAGLVSDRTEGFMTSGIVTLNLPDGIQSEHSVMPGGMFWLRVSAQAGMERFCSVYSVCAQALEVVWQGDPADKDRSVLPPLQITHSQKNIPGIERVLQIRTSFGGRPAETEAHFRTRVGERLRHKNRALNVADYELLILQHFAHVYKVKCFANLCSEPGRHIRAGHVLIIALPYLTVGGHANHKPLLSGHMIHEIAQFISACAPPFVTISVENPVYEEIQVRCNVRLKPGLSGGQYQRRINDALCEFLSPWHAPGYQRHFGWCIRQHDVAAFLLGLDYVEQVSELALLRVVPGGMVQDVRYGMEDNTGAVGERKDILPHYPWSIAVPMNEHWIVLQDRALPGALPDAGPQPVGIGVLQIGSTFIL